MGLTVSEQAANAYGSYSLKNSDAYKTYAADSSKVSKEYYNVSNLTDALDAMNDATDSASGVYTPGKVDSFVKSQYQFSQLGVYEDLKKKIDSYDVSGVLTNDTDLSGMYELANTSNQISSDYISSLLEAKGYTASAVSSYKSSLTEDSATGLLDITV